MHLCIHTEPPPTISYKQLHSPKEPAAGRAVFGKCQTWVWLHFSLFTQVPVFDLYVLGLRKGWGQFAEKPCFIQNDLAHWKPCSNSLCVSFISCLITEQLVSQPIQPVRREKSSATYWIQVKLPYLYKRKHNLYGHAFWKCCRVECEPFLQEEPFIPFHFWQNFMNMSGSSDAESINCKVRNKVAWKTRNIDISTLNQLLWTILYPEHRIYCLCI
jgi:hypothetical protein